METKKIVFFIDMKKVEVEASELTVKELLDLAEENPTVSTLALMHGNEIHKYTDINEMVPLKNGVKFVILHNEPTPVS